MLDEAILLLEFSIQNITNPINVSMLDEAILLLEFSIQNITNPMFQC